MAIDNNTIASVGLVKTLSDDIRTDKDNNVYSSAGAAVRAQVAKCDEALDMETSTVLGLRKISMSTAGSAQKTVSYTQALTKGDLVYVSAAYSGTNGSVWIFRVRSSESSYTNVMQDLTYGSTIVWRSDGDYIGFEIVARFSSPYTPGGNLYTYGGVNNGIALGTVKTAAQADITTKNLTVNVSGKTRNLYKYKPLLPGRVYQGVYDSTTSNMVCTDYIPVMSGHTYNMYGGYLNSENYTALYDNAKNYLGSITAWNEIYTTSPYNGTKNAGVWIVPEDVAYFRTTFLASDVVDGVLKTGYYEYYMYDVTDSPLADKRILIISDSISTDAYGDYAKWVTDLINEGVFSRIRTTNDSIHATGYVVATGGDNWNTRLRNHDPDDFDIVITFGSINDRNVDMDEYKTAVDSFYTYLTTNFYKCKLYMATALKSVLNSANTQGYYPNDYYDYLREVAKSYSIPLLDLFYEGNFYPEVEVFREQWTLHVNDHGDGTHPTEAWEKKFLAPVFKHWLTR